MKSIKFYKYQGTGNDFIIIDNRDNEYDNVPVQKLCNRRFGIGADGLMLLEEKDGFDFKMVYYNSDGNESTMCGNGGRCLAAFAYKLGIGNSDEYFFHASDGSHHALIIDKTHVSLKMNEVKDIKKNTEDYVLDTGSPHYVKFVEDVHTIDIIPEARAIRYAPEYNSKGINVNFVSNSNGHQINVRTYERGVEEETFSCGTGVTASAIALAEKDNFDLGKHEISINTLGGNLQVAFNKTENGYTDIWLTGPVAEAYRGVIELY